MENNKKDLHKDLDSICLKDHLNASFDNDNISVSEDLIARTLKAIKEQEQISNVTNQQGEISNETNKSEIRNQETINLETKKETKKETKIETKNSETNNQEINNPETSSNIYEWNPSTKKKPFPVRRLVSAAAILTVLFIGINVIQNSGLPIGGSKKDSTSNANENIAYDAGTYNTEGNDTTSISSADMVESSSVPTDGSEELKSFSNDEATLLEDDAKMTESVTEESGQVNIMTQDNPSLVGKEANLTQFSSLHLERAGLVVSASIDDNKQVTLITEGEQINELIGVLDNYTLELSDGNNNKTWYYTISFETENQFITIFIGEYLHVAVEADGNIAEYGYNINDMEALIKDVSEFFDKISNKK